MNARTTDGKLRPIPGRSVSDLERDRSDARAWRRFEAAGLLTRLWLAVRV